MLLKPSVLEERGISVTDQPADGDYMDVDQVELSTIDRRLIEKALATPSFKEVYAYAGPERFYADPDRTSGASMQMLYSDDLKQALILYLDPGLSDVVIGSVALTVSAASWVVAKDRVGGDDISASSMGLLPLYAVAAAFTFAMVAFNRTFTPPPPITPAPK